MTTTKTANLLRLRDMEEARGNALRSADPASYNLGLRFGRRDAKTGGSTSMEGASAAYKYGYLRGLAGA